MTFDDWLLALHLLSAFALVGALTIFSIGFVALRSSDTAGRVLAIGSLMRVGQASVVVGIAGTIVFGVWLAISVDAYQVWDLWVILAIVGWVAASAAGGRSGGLITPAFERAATLATDGQDGPDAELAAATRLPLAHTLHWISATITVLVLVDMIWKPGA
jgi:hypothetical protein